MEQIRTESIKEINTARNIVDEIRNFGVNDNIICMIVEQLALDLTDIELMRAMRELASRGSIMTELKQAGLDELEKVQQELTTANTGGINE
jgi:hypothetical protein